ncbi:MAG: helix-turn-helix domain-containing protein, partial [Motiliproteus sp.]
ATNRNLEKMVESGEFREDLYFRLNIFNIELPPLRERSEDIPFLLDFFIQRESKKIGLVDHINLDGDAKDLLCQYSYPGNIRELENIIARALILAEDNVITTMDLPQQVLKTKPQQSVDGLTLREQVQRFEISAINQAINECDGDRRVAAKRLGLGLSSLYRKLEDSA